MIDGREIVEDRRDLDVVGTARLFLGNEGVRVKGTGLRGVTRNVVNARECGEAAGERALVLALLNDRQGRLRERLGFRVLTLGNQDPGKMIRGRGEGRVVLAQRLCFFLGELQVKLRLFQASFLEGFPAGVVLGLPVRA